MDAGKRGFLGEADGEAVQGFLRGRSTSRTPSHPLFSLLQFSYSQLNQIYFRFHHGIFFFFFEERHLFLLLARHACRSLLYRCASKLSQFVRQTVISGFVVMFVFLEQRNKPSGSSLTSSDQEDLKRNIIKAYNTKQLMESFSLHL